MPLRDAHQSPHDEAPALKRRKEAAARRDVVSDNPTLEGSVTGLGDVSASRKRAPRRPSSPAADRVPARSRTQRCQHRRQIQLQPAKQIESFLLLHDKVRPAQALIHEGAPVGVPSAPPRPPRRRRSFTS